MAHKLGKLAVYHNGVFRAAWPERRHASTLEHVQALSRELGCPEVADGLEEPAIKAELRALTEDAAARGAFGVPTFFVGDEMFWGHDRMDYVQRALV